MRFVSRAAPALLLLLGLTLAHHDFLAGPGRLLPGDPIDSSFNHYLLEHEYRWASGHAANLWNPEFFYPQPNTLAYSDMLLGVFPFYGLWRAVGFGPGAAYQLWLVSLSLLNFLVMYFFLRRVLTLDGIPSALGAYLFAFGSPRLNQILGSHSQLWAEFYVVLALWFLIRYLESQKPLWLALASAATALQLISGFYFGWFLCFCLLIAGLAYLVRNGVSLDPLRRNWPAIALASLVFAAIAGPSLFHYLAAVRQLGAQDLSSRTLIMPTLGSWIYAGDTSLLYSWISKIPAISRVGSYFERANGVGFLTGALVLYGAFLWRGHRVFRWFLWVTVAVLVVSFTLPGGYSLWRPLTAPIPGAFALRIVSRWGVFLLLPFAAALAAALDHFFKQRGWAAIALLAPLIVAEQVVAIRSYDFQVFRNQAVQYIKQLRPDCDSFLVTTPAPKMDGVPGPEVAAMWAQLISGVPTLNGYSGNLPPDYPFFAPEVNPVDYMDFLNGLYEWQADHKHPLGTCWLRPDPSLPATPDRPLTLEVINPKPPALEMFIRWSYLGLLGRLPARAEAEQATPQIEDKGRVQWVLDLMQTPESLRRAFVVRAYQATLGREPDPDGWWSASSQISSGTISKQQLVLSLLNTAEYRHRCAIVHCAAEQAADLVRRIDSGEFDGNRTFVATAPLLMMGYTLTTVRADYWTRQLDSGVPRTALIDAILESGGYLLMARPQI